MKNPLTTLAAWIAAFGTAVTQIAAWLGGEPRSAPDLVQVALTLAAAWGLYKARDPE
ncbi:MAG: hypothetical protein QN130_12435 [Armatimonadota bacterium]|nr:hypothetical protein [Armatimonadota bacterium]